ncbi:hypothetical protein B0I31_108343 [Saccharothrix carnea]|uniref:UDP-N-acetyl-alpha-D-muramoyl-L-alanyl-L-glutamate epimerase n=1 Tax=Saccharothrix carnea TaxID=1280637 RepID=A0A2P8I634_SACCR|nr:hypothetical protein [Saccharothrix carnea]PSL53896.1 hypothetical protein B0I31_108343 [Saccharothrix carnea]
MTNTFRPSSYTTFEYVSYSVSSDGTIFTGHYQLSGREPSVSFQEIIELPPSDRAVDTTALHRLLFLACGLSYYKAAAPPVIRVDTGLTEAERRFLTELIRHGLGEFAYRNQLPGALRPTIEAEDIVLATADSDWDLSRPPLVPVGGGKDSVVSLESLKAAGHVPVAFSVNQFDPIDACVRVSGLSQVRATRKVDRTLIELNKAGAYNGHVPVTAINSLVALISADRLGLGAVVMSNEGSADYGNLRWEDIEVNHQWSKSMEFELLLRGTLSAAGLAEDRYFSLLRPLSEISIAKRFAGLPQYFPVFTSCNRLFALDPDARRKSWCGTCPKCQFVFLILAPFIPADVLKSIFGSNLLDNLENLPAYEEILGLKGHKPFECVGDYDEAGAAFRIAAEQADWRETVIVKGLLDEVRTTPSAHEAEVSRLMGVSRVHAIPALFQEALDAIG